MKSKILELEEAVKRASKGELKEALKSIEDYMKKNGIEIPK